MVPVSDSSPYPTLAPLDIGDVTRFFGRARKVQKLRQLLEEKKVVTIVGPCGAGKTSLLRAGLCAGLVAEFGDGLAVFEVAHPGLGAFAALEKQGLWAPADDLTLAVRSVAASGKRVVLLFDHLEELLFAETYDRENVVAQLATLAQAIREGLPAQLVLAVVPDALSSLAVVAKGLWPLFEVQTLWLSPLLDVGEWMEMVKGPARQANLRIEDGLLAALGKDLETYFSELAAEKRCGAVLPFLIGCLQKARQIARLSPTANTLSADDYHSAGGLFRALPEQAESGWRGQPPALQPLQRRMLMLLVHRQKVAEGELLFSRPRRKSELLENAGSGNSRTAPATEALNRLLAVGILRQENDTDVIELASKGLLSAWPELVRWPDEERRFENWQGEMLAFLPREGNSLTGLGGQPQSQPAHQLFGHRLAEAERYLLERGPQIDPRVARFIKTNLQAQPRRAVPSVAQRRRFLPWIAVALLSLATVLLLFEEQRLGRVAAEHADKMASEQGARAALLVQQSGQDGAALALAISAIAPALRSGQRVPTAAKEGLMLTFSAAKNSLPLFGHKDRIELVAFDPGGELVVTGSTDRTARIWNARTGRPLRELAGHTGLLTSVLFSVDGRQVLTASTDGTARLWKTETGELFATLRGHNEPIEMATFSHNGDRIITASQDQTARVWDSATGGERLVLRGHTDRVPMAVFAPSGNTILSVSFDKTVRQWDAQTGKELRLFEGHRHRVNLIAVSSDGRRAVSGSWDGTSRLWSLEPGAPWPAAGVEMEQGTPLHALQFSPDGAFIASAGANGVVKLWDGRTGEPRGVLFGHVGVVDALTFTHDGKYLVTAGHDRIVRLWDVASHLMIAVLRGHFGSIYGLAVSGKSDKIATASHDRTARIWDLRLGQPLLVLSGHSRYVSASAFSPDGTRIATASHDHTAKLWKWPGGELLATLDGHDHLVTGVVFSSDGKRIATASSDGTARIWDGQSGRKLSLLRGHKGAVHIVRFAPDGRRLLSSGADQMLRLWDVERQLLLVTEKGPRGSSIQASFSPDGQWVVTSGSEGETVIRDGTTLQVKRVLPTNGQNIIAVIFLRTPQGLKLVTASDHAVSKWNVDTGAQQVLLTLPSPVQLAALSPSGEHLLVVGTDNSLLLWDMVAEMPLWRWSSMPLELSDANFAAPDGRYFLLSTADGKTLVFSDDYRSNLSGTLTDACNLLRYQPDFQAVSSYCP